MYHASSCRTRVGIRRRKRSPYRNFLWERAKQRAGGVLDQHADEAPLKAKIVIMLDYQGLDQEGEGAEGSHGKCEEDRFKSALKLRKYVKAVGHR